MLGIKWTAVRLRGRLAGFFGHLISISGTAISSWPGSGMLSRNERFRCRFKLSTLLRLERSSLIPFLEDINDQKST